MMRPLQPFVTDLIKIGEYMRREFAKIYQTASTQLENNHIVFDFIAENEKFKYFLNSPAIQTLYISCYNSIKTYFLQKNITIPHDFSSYIYKVIFLFQAKDLSPEITLENFDTFANIIYQ
ncbi:MAG: hypothetical protein RCG15_00565 [Candidatus Rickettsia vulgarisii]